MSLKTKKRFKNLAKTIGIAVFALLLFTNIKVALMDDAEIANDDISVLGIELTLFDATYGESSWLGGPAYCNSALGSCFNQVSGAYAAAMVVCRMDWEPTSRNACFSIAAAFYAGMVSGCYIGYLNCG